MTWIYRERWRRIRCRGLSAYLRTSAAIGAGLGLVASALLRGAFVLPFVMPFLAMAVAYVVWLANEATMAP